MTATIIDGNAIAADIRAEVAREAQALKDAGVTPGLAAILVGDNPASATYVRNKGKACEEVGIYARTFHMPQDTSEGKLLELIGELNRDPTFHGILVQMPLPPQISEAKAVYRVLPEKDVDGLHPISVGRLAAGEPIFVPCTPAGVQEMLLRSGHSPEGKRVVICGRSNIVGKPLALLLMQKRKGANATVTVCHTGTRDLAEVTRQADILIAAMGSPASITADMVREGTVVIDVGVNRVADATRKSGFRLVGDVDFEAVKEKAAAISPVPGGVGPMTIAMLLVNTAKAARLKLNDGKG